jgi:hypothetical protein
MATLQTLRRKAISAGMPTSKARKASQRELSDYLANGKPRKSTAVKAVKKAKAVKASAKRVPAAKSRKGKAKRPAISRAKTNGKSGRNIIEGIDFSITDGWNPRPGSKPDQIIKALKKARGNRQKAFDALEPNVWDFVSKTKRNGQKNKREDAEQILMYRIHRTLYDFAKATGQHTSSTNRIVYGTGPNASKQTQRKLAKSRAKAPAAPTKAKRGRGRPKGSKNKPK